MFKPQRLVGPRKQLKQITQIERQFVKNPNWPETKGLANYKRGRGFQVEAANPGSGHSATQVWNLWVANLTC